MNTDYNILKTVFNDSLAREMLAVYGDIPTLENASEAELRKCGLNNGHIEQLNSIKAFSRRFFERTHKGESIQCSKDIFDLYRNMMTTSQERFLVIPVNSRNQVLSEHIIAMGSVNECQVKPREVFRPAIQCSAAAVVVVHNHPSGESVPSSSDVALTKRLVQAGEAIGISVIDHIVIGHESYSSLRDLGIMGER